jgi:protease IV
MWRFIVGLLATVGTLTLLGIGGCAAFLASAPFTTKPLPQNLVL